VTVNQPSESFLDLVRRATEAYDRGLDVSSYEEAFEAVLQYIEAHPDREPMIKERFLAMVREDPAGHRELIEFCMHRLRWNEIRNEINEQLRNTESIHRAIWSGMRSAFEDGWEMKELYRLFSDDNRDI
jgi:hypothetical protein